MSDNTKNNGMIATDVLAPTRVIAGKYHLGKVIGEGGMGSVYAADHHDLGTKVAVKLLSEASINNPKSLARFRREAKVMGQIRHQNVVQVMDAGTDEAGTPFLVMELLDGESLASTLRRERVLSQGLSAWVISEILAGLGAAHAKNIIHRDLKPGNVFVATQSDGSQRVKLLDFGISKLGDDNSATLNVTAVGALVGTPNFMAPEQILANVELDGRIDLYATGIMLYRMVTGKLPYLASSAEDLYRSILQAKPTAPTELRPELSKAVEAVILKAIHPKRDERYQTALEFQEALQAAVPSESYNPSRQLSSMAIPQSGMNSSTIDLPDDEGITAATRPSSPAAVAAVAGHSGIQPPTHGKTWQWIAALVIVLGAVVGGVVTYTITKGNNTGDNQANENQGATPVAVPQPEGEPLYFGIRRYKDPDEIRSELAPLANYLAKAVDRPVEIKVIDNYESFTNLLGSGEVHLVAMSAFNYISTKEKLGSLELLATPTTERGATYGAYILSRADSGIRKLKDFKGRSFCYPGKTSSSGYIFPRAALEKVGLDIDKDPTPVVTPDHNYSLQALLNGGCDGASVYDAAFQKADITAFTSILNIKDIPWDAYCASGSLDAETTEKLRTALTQLQLGSPLAQEVLGNTSLKFKGFLPSNDSLYDSVRKLL